MVQLQTGFLSSLIRGGGDRWQVAEAADAAGRALGAPSQRVHRALRAQAGRASPETEERRKIAPLRQRLKP